MMRIFSAFFAASFLLLPGCADDAPAGRNDPVPPACEGQQYGLTVTDPPTAVLRLTYQQTGTVSFRYTDCTGAPLAGYQVNFSAAGATAGAVLQAASAPTDADGVAIATVQSSDAETDFDLKASALNAPDASARISVRSKDGGDLEVRLVYRGRKQLQGARVLAVAAPLDCATLDPALPPTALELKDVQSLRDKVRFTLSGEPSVALIAIGKGSTAAPAAVGCLAGPVAIKNGAKEVKEVELVDVKPSYAGTYDVTNNFNLVKILPEGIGFYIEQLGNLFQNPGATAVEWLKNAPGVRDTPGVGTFLDGVGGDLVGDLANEAFATYTEGTPLGDAFSMGAEIDDILRKLEIISTWSILEEPGEDGKFGPDTIEERWDALVITWTTGVCEGDDAAEGCGRNEYAWAGGETLLDPVEARPTGSISADNPFLMTVDPHGIKFDTGKIAMFIIEKVVLPRLIGYDSFESFIHELLGGAGCLTDAAADPGDDTPEKVCCRAFAEKVTDEDGLTRNTARTLCNGGIGPVVTLVKGKVETLEADSDDNMTLGTVKSDGTASKPCELFDADADNVVEALGAPPGKRCQWQVEVHRAEGEPIDFTGDWHGVRR